MKLRINGEERELTAGITVQTLLAELSLNEGPVAVEVNAEVVRRALHPSHCLQEGDEVEIVTFVGGG